MQTEDQEKFGGHTWDDKSNNMVSGTGCVCMFVLESQLYQLDISVKGKTVDQNEDQAKNQKEREEGL